MKKSIISASVVLALSVSSSAFAGLLANNTTYTVTVNAIGSCFAFSDCTALGVDNVQGGSFTITTSATGDAFSVGNYAIGTYTNTPLGILTTGGTVNGTGTVGAGGQLELTFTGRTIFAEFFASLGTVAWNIDDSVTITSGTSGEYEHFTSGTDTNLYRFGFGNNISLSGNHLSDNGDGTYSGVIVSAGNLGAVWGPFDGAAYTEVYDITISSIPVPAGAWLFGSGLLGIVGLARRRALFQ